MQDPDAFDLGGFEFSASSHNAKEGGFTSYANDIEILDN